MTTGKWEKALAELAGYADLDQRRAKSARFMSGIRRFSQFLVDAAKQAPEGVQFEREASKARAGRAAKRTAGKASSKPAEGARRPASGRKKGKSVESSRGEIK